MEPLYQPPTKKPRLSGGARRIMKEKEKSVKGNKSILSFVQSFKKQGSILLII
jgi:hypothetical protein